MFQYRMIEGKLALLDEWKVWSYRQQREQNFVHLDGRFVEAMDFSQ